MRDTIKLVGSGTKCVVEVLIRIVLFAAGRKTSIEDACLRLKNGPKGDAVRAALFRGLPKLPTLTRRINEALQKLIPGRALRKNKKGQRLAIDLTLIPYHGKPFKNVREVYRGEAKSGTTHFHAYATCYLVNRGCRSTVAVVYVLKGTSLETVIEQLLESAKDAGIRPRLLLLDRGFFQAGVIAYLQAWRIPFLMPMTMRGRKPTHPKGPSGTYALTAQKRSGWSTYTWTGRNKKQVTVSVCLARTRRRNGKGSITLAFAYGGIRPTQTKWVRETYRERFGIESSYRQMNQARIYTCTRNPLLRFFYVATALILRNLWVWFHYLFLSTPRRGERELRLAKMRFRVMLHWIIHVVESMFGFDDQAEAHVPAAP
jgi:putative transposase